MVLSGSTLDGVNGDVAVDQYHRYKVLLFANLRPLDVPSINTYIYWLLVTHPQALGPYQTSVLLFLYACINSQSPV